MARRVIGLDVGTNAVRVAEVELADVPVLHTFGQVSLPVDAMRDGEVLDPGAVTAAIQRLWRELGLKKGEVRVGIGGPRVIVRTVDMPAMSDADLEGALRFQAQELIPIPLDDAIVDFQVLESLSGEVVAPVPPVPPAPTDAAEPATEPVPLAGLEGQDPAGATVNRVLVAAAHIGAVRSLLDAVRGAGLTPTAVDLVPLALVRELGRRVNGSGAEGIVSIGGGVTVIAVHEAGLPRFVRMLGTGGRALTEAIAHDLELTLETAEALKRQGANSPPELAPRVAAALEAPTSALLEEIRGSLDYWRTQPGSGRLARVLITGGASQQDGLADGLARVLGVPVELAEPRAGTDVGEIGFPPDELDALDPYLPVPIGLALGGGATGKRINLVGDKVAGQGDTRQLVFVAVAVALGLLLLLGLLTFQRQQALSDAKDDLSAQQAENAALQRQIDALNEAQQNQATIDTLTAQITTILENDVSWAVQLQEIARTIPDDTWLTAYQGTVTTGSAAPTAATTPVATPGGVSGTVSFSATGLDFPAIANWLTRVGDIPSYSNVWVPTATSSDVGGRTVVEFTSNAALTAEAQSDRKDRFDDGAAGG